MNAPATTWDADDAVTHLYAAHHRSLVRLATLLLRDVAEGEDVVQDAFVAMHGMWGRLRDPHKALAYRARQSSTGPGQCCVIGAWLNVTSPPQYAMPTPPSVEWCSPTRHRR